MNHVDEGGALLLSQFKNSPKLNAVLGVFLAQSQELEELFEQLGQGNLVIHALGNTLNMLGKIINQPRSKMKDDEYKLWLKARAIINKSSGTNKALTQITDLLLGPKSKFILREERDHVLLQVNSALPHKKANQVFKLLNHAKPLGIEMIMKYSPEHADTKIGDGWSKFTHTLREL